VQQKPLRIRKEGHFKSEYTENVLASHSISGLFYLVVLVKLVQMHPKAIGALCDNGGRSRIWVTLPKLPNLERAANLLEDLPTLWLPLTGDTYGQALLDAGVSAVIPRKEPWSFRCFRRDSPEGAMEFQVFPP